jgi:hypothetical protein
MTLRRFSLISGCAVLLVAAVAVTRFANRPVKAQVVPTRDVFVFHCALIPNQTLETSNLGSFNLTFSGPSNVFTSPSDCSKVMLDALNAGYKLKSELSLPNGGPQGTGATEYVFIRGDND